MNAREELLEHTQGRRAVYVSLVYGGISIKGTLEEVLPQLNFEYDDDYGWQELFGHVWYDDGSWSDRGEYDGSEWWVHRTPPDRDRLIFCTGR